MRKVLAAAAVFVLAGIHDVSALTRAERLPGIETIESGRLKAVAAWLNKSGREGYLAADVADAAGISRAGEGQALEARQRGFKSGGVLRIAQIPLDGKRDFLLFMVQRPAEVRFYLSSVRAGLKKAFVFVPAQNAVLPLEAAQARSDFQHELLFWEQRASGEHGTSGSL